VIAGGAAAVALFYSLWAVALALLFGTRLQIPPDYTSARATLILSAAGALPGLKDLLTQLTVQSLPPCKIIIVVESREDPIRSALG
jgi:hypothetical protein